MNVLVLLVLFFNALSVFSTAPPSLPPSSTPATPPPSTPPPTTPPPTTPPPTGETTSTNGNHGRKFTDAPTMATPKGLTDGSRNE